MVTEVAPEGRVAALTVSAVLAVSGVVCIAAGWDELWRRCGPGAEACATSAAAAGLASLFALGAVGAGVWWWRRAARQPVDPNGSSIAVFALAGLFALGMLLLAWRIPAFTCERGRFDEVLQLCMHPPGTSQPISWSLAKVACGSLAVAGATAIALWPRLVRVWAPAAVIAWIAGAGLLLSQTLLG